MPNARHRWVDVGGHHSARAAAKPRRTQHAAKVTRRSAAQTYRATKKHAAIKTHRATKKHGTIERHKAKSSHADSAGARLSSKTIRRCRTLNYRQIMRSSDCRALMKQELAGTDTRSGRGRKAERHKAAGHRHKAAAQHQKTSRSHHQATKQRKK